MAWRDGEGGKDVRQGRADPVRSAASLVDLQSRDTEEAMQTRRFKVLKDQMDKYVESQM